MTPVHTPGCCRCCASPNLSYLWTGTLIDIQVGYYECPACGYVQTEEPHWLDRAYSDVINDSDTGLVARNLVNARHVVATLGALGDIHGQVVDYAGGYGLLVRLLRDQGVDALWRDRYCTNLLARGFEHTDEQATLVTAFEAFEHFVDPQAELCEMLRSGRNLLASTVLIPDPAPAHDQWWYYGAEHGQHVGLFRLRTLRALADKHGLHLASNGRDYHLFSAEPVHPRRWRSWLKAGKYLTPWLTRGLASKTQSDHQALSRSVATSNTTAA